LRFCFCFAAQFESLEGIIVKSRRKIQNYIYVNVVECVLFSISVFFYKFLERMLFRNLDSEKRFCFKILFWSK